jgi:hypothetical protein
MYQQWSNRGDENGRDDMSSWELIRAEVSRALDLNMPHRGHLKFPSVLVPETFVRIDSSNF